MRLPRTWTARVLVIVALIGLPSAALGYWTAVGTGTTSITLRDPLPLVLGPGTAIDQLSPGTAGDVYLVVSNPNPFVVHIGSFVQDVEHPISVDAGHGGCDVSALSFSTPENGWPVGGWDVSPKVGASDGTLSIELGGSLLMSATAANACQGAQFQVPLDVTPS